MNQTTLAQRLKALGYTTGLVGKSIASGLCCPIKSNNARYSASVSSVWPDVAVFVKESPFAKAVSSRPVFASATVVGYTSR